MRIIPRSNLVNRMKLSVNFHDVCAIVVGSHNSEITLSPIFHKTKSVSYIICAKPVEKLPIYYKWVHSKGEQLFVCVVANNTVQPSNKHQSELYKQLHYMIGLFVPIAPRPPRGLGRISADNAASCANV